MPEFIKIMGDQLTAAQKVIKEASDYLDTNNMTNIMHGSIMHIKFKDALGEK